jgi:hypothetical protein
MLKQVHNSAGRSGPNVRAAENDPSDASVHNCASTHRTRFFGHVQIAINQSPITHCCLSCRQRQHFGMSSGVLKQLDLIVTPGDDLSRSHNHGTDRDLVRSLCFFCETQRLTHEFFVGIHWSDSQLTQNMRVVEVENTSAHAPRLELLVRP